jgi:hypothetical protein
MATVAGACYGDATCQGRDACSIRYLEFAV